MNWSPNSTPQPGDSGTPASYDYLHFTDNASQQNITDDIAKLQGLNLAFSAFHSGLVSYQISFAPGVEMATFGISNNTSVGGGSQLQTFILQPDSKQSVQVHLAATDTFIQNGNIHVIELAGGMGSTNTTLNGTTSAGIGNTFTQQGANSTNATGTGTLTVADTASLGASTLVNQAAGIAGTTATLSGGSTGFYDHSTAGNSTITNQSTSLAKAYGGSTTFYGNSTLESASVNNQGGGTSYGSGATRFNNNSTAGNGTINNNSGTNYSAGLTGFSDSSTAGSSTINNNGGAASSAYGGYTVFSGNSTAGNATITNDNGAGFSYGSTVFSDSSNAGNATIHVVGGAVGRTGGGSLSFNTSANAASATITADGGTVIGSMPASIRFSGNATAGNATITVNGGTNNGSGAQVFFQNSAKGGNAKVVLGDGAVFDISALTSGSISFGSLEGAGTFNLGGNALTVGSLNSNTTISGVLADGGFLSPGSTATGASFRKTGTGILKLGATNTYTGATIVTAGTLLVDGSVAAGSAVSVSAGATLGGSGTVFGTVAVADGGILSPGDSPGRLTVGSLSLSQQSVLNFQLGSSSDQIAVGGNLTFDGVLNVSDAGGFGNGVYTLFTYSGTLTDNGAQIGVVPAGYAPGQFTLTASNGQVLLEVVPEPAELAELFLAGLAAIPLLHHRRKPPREAQG